jgi:hypothetical protein
MERHRPPWFRMQMMLIETEARNFGYRKKMALPSTPPHATIDAIGYSYFHLISLALNRNYSKPWVEIGDILYINGTAAERDARRSQRPNHA